MGEANHLILNSLTPPFFLTILVQLFLQAEDNIMQVMRQMLTFIFSLAYGLRDKKIPPYPIMIEPYYLTSLKSAI